MQGNNLFEYAVIRYVPRPEREEFVNVGVILFCHSKKFLRMKHHLDPLKLRALYGAVDLEELASYLNAFNEVCCGQSKTSPIAKLDNASRFRWLTSARSTIMQTSKVHPGFCDDPQVTLEKLHQQLVEN